MPAIADAGVIVPLRKTFYGMHEITVREPGAVTRVTSRSNGSRAVRRISLSAV